MHSTPGLQGLIFIGPLGSKSDSKTWGPADSLEMSCKQAVRRRHSSSFHGDTHTHILYFKDILAESEVLSYLLYSCGKCFIYSHNCIHSWQVFRSIMISDYKYVKYLLEYNSHKQHWPRWYPALPPCQPHIARIKMHLRIIFFPRGHFCSAQWII